MASAGVPAGAMTAYQPVTSKPAMPCSWMVGTSGASAERCGLVTASACMRPLRIWGMEVEMLSKVRSMSPASMALTTPALPL